MMTFQSRWVLPIDNPPIEHGAIAVEHGRVIAIGTARDMPRGERIDFGNAILLPGFVNAHTHLDLTGLRGRIAPSPLVDWFDRMLNLFARGEVHPYGRDAVLAGAAESLAAGVTCVGDISRSGLNVEALAVSPIRKVCFLECISGGGMGPGDVDSLRESLAAAARRADGEKCFIGLSPHAPYSVLMEHVRGIVELAQQHTAPLTMHLLETREEREWLEAGRGVFAEFLSMRLLPTAASPPKRDVIRWLEDSGISRVHPLLAHANYATAPEIEWMTRNACSVAFCPRAHRYFGHAVHPWPRMLAAGVNVCLGTDSLGCNDSLSILDEARFVFRCEGGAEADTLLAMGTIRAARALGLGERIGSLAVGKCADFVVIPSASRGPSPSQSLLAGEELVSQTWIGGARVWPA